MINPMQLFQMFGGQQQFLNQYNNFSRNFQQGGLDPKQQVQNLLNSGQMSQEQFNQLRYIANAITGRQA